MIFCLPIFADNGFTGIVLSEEEEVTLQLLTAALRVSNNSPYTSRIRYFGEGEGQRKWVIVEALLSNRLSRFILTSEPDDCLYLPLAIDLT